MKDFEEHDRGTFEEIRLSRALARAVVDAETQFALPLPILEAMRNLQDLYTKQLNEEQM